MRTLDTTFALRRSMELSNEHDDRHDEPVMGCVKCVSELYRGVTHDIPKQVEELFYDQDTDT